MKQTLGFTLSLVLTVIMLAILYSGPAATPAAAQGGKLDGKAIFLAQKCNLCHSVSTAGIAATTKSEKMKGPDLVNIKHDAKLLNGFLRKTADVNGKKHVKGFTGSDEELGALMAWLQAQKKK
ncbi:MAG TPA: cytochrome c [Thermoanaerobaculia bacterium]|nr:cytochrome c [Thermoanaerobaculia bacterium]